jgi:pancreatic lipase-related protein 1/phosphatidic acid-selective phospholipase A1
MTVYTRDNRLVGQVITRNTIPPAFDGNKMAIFLVHGWLGSKDNNWLHDMKDELLTQGDFNVIIVGWEGGSQQIWYPQSASDTRTVGTEIGLVAANVIANGNAAKSRLYCVGHSLGSHVCGHAGAYTTFGRITGMDPAGPLFENRDWTCGLNPSCADLVDVMHTNGEPGVVLNLGTMKVLGHVDFYPNGGGRQPECILDPLKTSPEQKADLTPACSHMRAISYYIESVNTQCFYSRYQCTDQYNLPGSCTSSIFPSQNMGYAANTYGGLGIFYLETNGASPYCLG